jgi:DNA-binding beta-propeller fold protein YncE
MNVVADLKRAHRATRRMNRMTRTLTSCIVVAGAWLALAGGAAAAPGQIAYDGCLASDSWEGCFDLPSSPLMGARGVAVSPDDKSVYAASFGAATVGHFFRGGPLGRLAWDGCLGNDGSQSCGDLPGAPIPSANAVAASPDGKSVYVVSGAGDSIARFSRTGPDGQISYGGCLNNDGSQGCGDLPAAPIDGPAGVAVSPDGKSLYVASFNGDSIAHFFSRGPEGQFAWDGCLNNDGSQSCGDLPFAPIEAASGVAVSPDGSSVYVTAAGGDAIAHLLATGPEGQISWDGCLNNDGSQGCGDLPGAPLDGASGVATSRDGKSVYVALTANDSAGNRATARTRTFRIVRRA